MTPKDKTALLIVAHGSTVNPDSSAPTLALRGQPRGAERGVDAIGDHPATVTWGTFAGEVASVAKRVRGGPEQPSPRR